MSLAIFLKAIAIAICAGLAAWGYFVAGSLGGGGLADDLPRSIEVGIWLLWPTLFASFTIGFPVALLTFVLARRHLVQSPTTLAMVTVLAGIMMVLTSYWIAEEDGVLALGIPAFIAALTYGILGWFWIIKPMQRAEV
ncbi:MAG: hypothetical protein AAF251_01415 [Pseudomonadota bacterium]